MRKLLSASLVTATAIAGTIITTASPAAAARPWDLEGNNRPFQAGSAASTGRLEFQGRDTFYATFNVRDRCPGDSARAQVSFFITFTSGQPSNSRDFEDSDGCDNGPTTFTSIKIDRPGRVIESVDVLLKIDDPDTVAGPVIVDNLTITR